MSAGGSETERGGGLGAHLLAVWEAEDLECVARGDDEEVVVLAGGHGGDADVVAAAVDEVAHGANQLALAGVPHADGAVLGAGEEEVRLGAQPQQLLDGRGVALELRRGRQPLAARNVRRTRLTVAMCRSVAVSYSLIWKVDSATATTESSAFIALRESCEPCAPPTAARAHVPVQHVASVVRVVVLHAAAEAGRAGARAAVLETAPDDLHGPERGQQDASIVASALCGRPAAPVSA